MEAIPQSLFDQKMDRAILYTDLLGEQHCIRLGISQTQLMAKYAVQLEVTVLFHKTPSCYFNDRTSQP
jgi:hypothetical protein